MCISSIITEQAALLHKIPPLFEIKIVYSYVIKVADSESDLGLHNKALVSKIFAIYHLENALGRPGGHVHLGNSRKFF